MTGLMQVLRTRPLPGIAAYRVIYRVVEKQKQVDVLHIRHGARQEFKIDELT